MLISFWHSLNSLLTFVGTDTAGTDVYELESHASLFLATYRIELWTYFYLHCILSRMLMTMYNIFKMILFTNLH